MIHCVLHDAGDTVAVVVVEGVTAGTAMTGWVMDDDRDGVAGVVQYAMDQGRLPVQSSGHASGPIARPDAPTGPALAVS